MRLLRPMIVASCAAALCSCLYSNIKVPRGYRSASPAEVKAAVGDALVSGEACNKSMLWLFAWGDASYAKAVSIALTGHDDGILYDVRADIKVNSYVLGLYTKQCTIVTGKVGKP